MEGDTKKGNFQSPVKKPLVFHSQNIADTKAKEKREVFTKVEEKKTLKQSAEEFQKKFADAKAHAAESRARIENPGADANGVIRSHKRFNINWKLVRRITIPVIIIAGLAAAVYFNWGAIHHEFFEVSESRAQEFLPDNPERFIAMYDKLIEQETVAEEKARLLLTRAISLDAEHTQQIRSDVYAAEELYPSLTTAETIIWYEENYGSEAAVIEWTAQLTEREQEGKEITLGNG